MFRIFSGVFRILLLSSTVTPNYGIISETTVSMWTANTNARLKANPAAPLDERRTVLFVVSGKCRAKGDWKIDEIVSGILSAPE